MNSMRAGAGIARRSPALTKSAAFARAAGRPFARSMQKAKSRHFISPPTSARSFGNGGDPEGLVYDSGKKEVFVANSDSNDVSVISTTTNKVVALPAGGTLREAVAFVAPRWA